MTRRSILDGRQRSRGAVLARLARDLGTSPIPNLDALYDVLRRDVPGPVTIVWRPTAKAVAALGADFAALTGVLRQVAAERRDLRLDLLAPKEP